MPRIIFVFGSNEAGRHGAGAAKEARKKYGAIYGQGIGLQGNSYAIPTKDKDLNVLSLEKIEQYVKDFLKFTTEMIDHQYGSDYLFHITPIGCGLAGYLPEQIAPMFYEHREQKNLLLPWQFVKIWNRMNFSGQKSTDQNE